MKYEKLKAKAADYGTSIEGCAIENYPEIWKWMTGDMNSPDRWRFERTFKLTSDNRAAFKDLFGRQSFCWKGSEFYFHAYLFQLPGTLLLALTAKDKGTCYEMVTHRDGEEVPKDFKIVIEFLEWLADQLPARE